MSFNFRPTSAKEITDKKKLYSKPVSEVYTYIQKKYTATIVLDPTTNFSTVKIPRFVKGQDAITKIRLDLKKKGIDITGMTIDFGDGSGTGGSSINAEETSNQENATRLYCESYVETGKFPTMKATTTVYPKVTGDWIATFEAQAIAIKAYLRSKGYNWSRDTGIMPFLEGIAKTKCGVRTKDSWNPADIYCVKKTKEADIKAQLTKIGNLPLEARVRLDHLNGYMREQFAAKNLVGISLKKLSKGKVSTEETNTSKTTTIKGISIVKGSVQLNLDLKSNGEFETGEFAMKLSIGSSIVNVQIRSFSGGIRESTQMDMTGAGSAAKLGKVSSNEAIEPYISKFNLERRMGADLPKVGAWTAAEIKFYIEEHKKLTKTKIDGNLIRWGTQNWEQVLKKTIKNEQDNDRVASQLSAKLQCFQWVSIFSHIESKGKLSEFLTVLYYGAKKQYDSAGPFLKIS